MPESRTRDDRLRRELALVRRRIVELEKLFSDPQSLYVVHGFLA